MVQQIAISNYKRRIQKKEQQRLLLIIKSITSDKSSIILREAESPKKGIREIEFQVQQTDDKRIVCLIFHFLEILQGINYPFPVGSNWHSIKCGDYNITLYGGELGINF